MKPPALLLTVIFGLFPIDSTNFTDAVHKPDVIAAIVHTPNQSNKVSDTDRAGRTTRYEYDAANRLIKTIYPDDTLLSDTDNPYSTIEYNKAGQVSANVDERGNRSENEYDEAGRLDLMRNALLEETVYEYDELNRRTAVIDAKLQRTEFVYDDAGRLIDTIYPDDTPLDDLDNTITTTEYDKLGRKTGAYDQAREYTQYEYDPLGNLTAVIDTLGQYTRYGYDEQSNKISQTDAELNPTKWAYDDNGRVISRTLPLLQKEHYGHDNNGNRTSLIDFNAQGCASAEGTGCAGTANGDTTTYVYNDLNQQTEIHYFDGTSVITTYTATGQVDLVTDYRGPTDHDYDVQGRTSAAGAGRTRAADERERLSRILYPNGQSIDYEYDEAGNRTLLTTTSQNVGYSYDVLNRLKTVTDTSGITTYHYNEVGNRQAIDHANGTRVDYQYDEQNRLTELTNYGPLVDSLRDIITQHTYTLGDAGNRTQIAEATGRIVDYGYDRLYRLELEQVTDPTNGNSTTSWTYDKVGNRDTQTDNGILTSYTYDGNDRLQSETTAGITITYAYDDNGNTLSKTENGTPTQYSYNADNRLTSLNNGQVSYTYDAIGIRQSQTQSGQTTHFLVDPNQAYAQVIEEQDATATPQVQYTYGDDLISQTRDAQTSTYHYDGLGSTRALSDNTGTNTDAYNYEAFGELDTASGTTENSYLFTGEQYDQNLAQYYLRARYMDPGVGRFTTMDVFEGLQTKPLTQNSCIYAESSPVDKVDPSGYLSFALYTRVFVDLSRRMSGLAARGGAGTAAYSRMARLACKVGGKLAGTYIAVYKTVTGGTGGNASHHVIQKSLLKEFSSTYGHTYEILTGFAIPLIDGFAGAPHRLASGFQNRSANRGRTSYTGMLRVAHGALISAGCDPADARKIVRAAHINFKVNAN